MSATGGTQNTAAPDVAAVVRTYKPANPAAGAQLAFTATEQFELDAVRLILTTSAVVANRFMQLRILDGTGAVVWDDQPATVAASQSAGFNFYNGAGGQGAGNFSVQCSLPRLVIPVGWQIVTTTTGLDVADQYSAVVITGRIA